MNLLSKLAAVVLLGGALPSGAATEEEHHKHFTVQPGGKLVVNVDFGAIDVRTNATGEVVVEVWRRISRKSKADEEAFLRDNPVNFTQDGNTISVQSRQKNQGSWSWFSKLGSRNEARYVITVPAQFAAQLGTAGSNIKVIDLTGQVTANTSGGGLDFARLHGPLEANTSGGSIRVADCDGTLKIQTSGGGIDVAGGGGTLRGETSGGSVAVKSFRGPASLETSGGGIKIEDVQGAVDGSTSGGSINAALIAPLPGSVKLSTSGGSVTARIADTAAFNLDAETSGGGVSSQLPVGTVGRPDRDRLKGPVNGGGTLVELRTSGGNIRVEKRAPQTQALK